MKELILLIFLVSPHSVHSEDPIIEITNGKVKGEVMFTPNNRSFYAFRGIPYAKPPVGDLRFQPPQKPDNWEGVLDSDAKNRMCIQLSLDLLPDESEDCLYIHVYTPQLPTRGDNVSLPVMYVIHGGAFVAGSPTLEELGPHFLMDYDVIVVSVGYRLGFLGFLSTGDLNCPGNNGFKDQQFGLRWVRENIRSFGGDPKRVTIFGESAGGASVAFQLLGSNSEDLFIGAIQDSGTSLGDWTIQRNPKGIAYKFANHINSSITENNTSTSELLRFFSNLDVQQIKTSCSEVFGAGLIAGFYNTLSGFVFAGTIEPAHEGAFLTEALYQKFSTGNFHVVPTLIGFNSEECLFLALDSNLEERIAFYDKYPENYVLPDMHIEELKTKKLVGKKIREIYDSSGSLHKNKPLSIKYFSETTFVRPIIKQAEFESNYTDVYLYQFAYSGEMGRSFMNVDVPGAGKVVHGEELKYMFKAKYSKDIYSFPEEDRITMKRLLTMWTNFVKYQNPTPKPLEILQTTIWHKIQSLDRTPYLLINDTLEVKYDYRKETMEKYQNLYDTYAVPPLDTY